MLLVNLLGGFSVRVGAGEVPAERWRLRKAGHVVKLLALAPQHRLQRWQIIDALWPEADPQDAANNLRYTLHVARRTLDESGRDLIGGQGTLLVLGPTLTVQTDVEAFRTAARAAQQQGTAAAFAHAVSLYGGDLLPDDLHEEWTLAEREHLREQFLRLLLGLAEVHAAQGDTAAAIAAANRLLVVDRAAEAAHQLLMKLYAQSGQRAQALRQYTQLAAALQSEIGVGPARASTELHQAILVGHYPPPAPPRPAGAAAPSAPLHNLPHVLTSFVGRQGEIAQVGAALQSHRLVTLTGPGGAGKTRLALEGAGGLQGRFAQGVWLVELAGVQDPAAVPRAVADVLAVPEASGEDRCTTLIRHLRKARLLLVLDNAEHLRAACADLVHRLLRECPELRILVTSREELRVAGEVVRPTPPLTLPTVGAGALPADLQRFEAVELFVARAQTHGGGFALTPANGPAVAQICSLLDGLPLAIELAAARSKVLSPEQIAARLGDRFALLADHSHGPDERHQTLQAAVDWSYSLLTAAERTLWHRLSVFAGGMDLPAVEGVCAGADLPPAALLDLLTSLVEKSVVQTVTHTGHVRYRLLETIRTYGLQRLAAAGEELLLRRRHRDYFLALAKALRLEADRAIHGGWLNRLDIEHDNLRAALAWCRDTEGEAVFGLMLGAQLCSFWEIRAHWSEGLSWLQSLLGQPGAEARTPVRAAALAAAGTMAWQHGDADVASPLVAEAFSIFQEVDDERGLAVVLDTIGTAAMLRGPVPEARATIEGIVALSHARNDPRHIAWWTGFLGYVMCLQGEEAAGWALIHQSVGECRAMGDVYLVAKLLQVASVLLLVQSPARAEAMLQEVLTCYEELGDEVGLDWVTGFLGTVYLSQGRDADAEAALQQCVRNSRAINSRVPLAFALAWLGRLQVRSGELTAAAASIHESLRHQLTMQFGLMTLPALEAAAWLAQRREQAEAAACLLGAVAALSRQHGTVLHADAAAPDAETEQGQSSLDAASFAAAWARGEQMTLLEAIGHGLAVTATRDS